MTERQASGSVDLTNCDREPIHVPGAIQPHGLLLALRDRELTVAQVSANVGDHLGCSVEGVLGRPLATVLDEGSAESVRAALGHAQMEALNPLALTSGGRRFDGIVHRHEGAAILELEPVLEIGEGMHHPLRLALMGVQSASSLGDLGQSVVQEVRNLTGFERVMLYRFDAEGHGSVVAEARHEALEPYLGLHYPASDIPRQARRLYLKNWLRIIPEARYAPVALVPALRPDTGAPLDLSFSVLRSVSPVHLEYLANMGVRASMSISLVVRDQLWGLISCLNHTGPRRVSYERRAVCEILGRLTSLQIAAFEERDAAALRTARRGTQQVLAQGMRAGADVLEGLLDRSAELLSLVDADGVAVVSGDTCLSRGRVPESQLMRAIAAFLDERGTIEPFATESLAALFPPALPAKEVASGLLTFALPDARRSRLLWFRPEMIQTVQWGGDPRKAVQVDPALRLHPRRSFEQWKEEVRLRSAPWTASDLEAAHELRRFAIEHDLERQVEREQRAVRARDDLVAVVSHDLKNPLGVIQMQAALLPRIAGDEDSSRRLRGSAERIQRSVDRMNALIHDLLDLAKIEAGRFAVQCRPENVGDMIDEALVILGPLAEAKRLTLTPELLATARVSADRERFFQVLSNLVGNAIKFTPEGGSVVVRAERSGGELLFTVADTGPGIPQDQLPNVFNRYWQAQRANREGSGLGLYIAKGIVEAHGGRIWVEVPPGTGAQFKLTLPIC